jgi:hypothetical protein
MQLFDIRGETNRSCTRLSKRKKSQDRLVDFSAVVNATPGKTNSYTCHGDLSILKKWFGAEEASAKLV